MILWLSLAGYLLGYHNPPPDNINPITQTAHAYLGEDYVYGDQGKLGFDCSGLVQAVFERNGYVLPRTSREQVLFGEPIAWHEVRPGDVLFFTSQPKAHRITHVGIALDNQRMIHASRGHKRVVISRWQTPYYLHRLHAVRRMQQNKQL